MERKLLSEPPEVKKRPEKDRVLFLPDQHLGRNTAFQMGIGLDEMAVWNPLDLTLEFDGPLDKVKVILWKGHCSVHENFGVEHISTVRVQHPDMKVIVHPECKHEVVELSDMAGPPTLSFKLLSLPRKVQHGRLALR
ncbi:hypothetical protein MEZE111188_10980 [Mesobacillus zeae]